jgi:ADP-ribose pyrophosphatase
MTIKPWPVVRSAPKGDFHIFKIRQDTKTSPRTGREMDFVVLESRNWVNVVAVTRDKRLVMVEQFRHGSATVELEIPGGVMDAEDDSPVTAGLRELTEETGFEGDRPRLIGQVWSNPAIMNNRTYTVLVENCRLRTATRFDSGEDILTRLVPVADVPELVRSGQIRHSLVIVALHHYELLRQAQAGGR